MQGEKEKITKNIVQIREICTEYITLEAKRMGQTNSRNKLVCHINMWKPKFYNKRFDTL